MIPLYREPHYVFRFVEDRIVPRFHLESVEPGRRVRVFAWEAATATWSNLLTVAIAGDGGWVNLPEPIVVRAGQGFVAVPEENHT